MDDLFSFPDFRSERAELVMYRTPIPTRSEAEIERLISLWGFEGEPEDLGTRLTLRQDEQVLEIFHSSDSIWWSRTREIVPEPPVDVELLNEDDAASAANAFSEQRRLLDDRLFQASITYTEVMRSDGPRAEPQSVRVAQHVNYAFQLEGLPLFGPGAKVQVTFDNSGVACAYRFWREPVADHTRPLLSTGEALEVIRGDGAFADLDPNDSKVSFEAVSLGYYALPARETQGFLIPVYAFEGTVSTPYLERYEFVRYLVAVPFSADEAKSLGAVGTRAPRLFS